MDLVGYHGASLDIHGIFMGHSWDIHGDFFGLQSKVAHRWQLHNPKQSSTMMMGVPSKMLGNPP